MSSTAQAAPARTTSAWSGPLQAVLAALAVCVLYWAVGINETPASASQTSVSHAVPVAAQIATTTASTDVVGVAYGSTLRSHR